MNVTTLLTIAQQSEYDLHYIREWYSRHQNEKISLQPERWTLKLQLIKALCFALFFLSNFQKVQFAISILQPLSNLVQRSIQWRAAIKLRLLQSKGLVVIAIAGSYGKTSTKQDMKNLLAKHFSVLATEESINTPIGLAQTIVKKLKPAHQIFIAELGEYYPGDISRLTKFIQPNFGVLTPIGQQHLERMGSMDAIAKTVGELVDYFADNTENIVIADENTKYFPSPQLQFYGQKKDSPIRLVNPKVDWQGTEFDVELRSQSTTEHVFTPLLGKSQVLNILPTFWLADKLNVEIRQLVAACATLPYVERRNQPMFLENSLNIVDNSYNTNPQSAAESLQFIKDLPAKRRMVITMGFVELGEQAESLNKKFGEQLAAVADYIGILNSPWSQAIIDGYMKAGGKKDHVVEAETQEAAMTELRKFVMPDTMVLFEGGFQEKYV